MTESQGTPNAGAPTYAELAKDIAEGSFFDASIVPLRGMEVEVVGTEVLPNRFAKGDQNPWQAIAKITYEGARKPMRANAANFIRAVAALELSDSGEIVGHKYTLVRGAPSRNGNPTFAVAAVDGKDVPGA